MTIKEKIISALKGNLQQTVTLTVYDFLFTEAGIDIEGQKVKELCSNGLGLIRHVDTYKISTPGIEMKSQSFIEDGKQVTINTFVTPIGGISSKVVDHWVQEYFLKSAQDYKVMEYIVRHQIITPDYEAYFKAEKEIGENGIVVVTAQRSPYQKILVDYAGLEQFSFHLADEYEEIDRLFDALFEKQKEIFKVICDGPGEVIKLWENVTGDAIGPQRFRKYHMPVYRELYPLAHASGKLLALHYDGRLSCLKDEICEIECDILESFTPPPEGDIPFNIAFDYWPDKIFWLTIPAHAYLSEESLRDNIRSLISVCKGKRLLLEIAEYFPTEMWYESISILLDILSERK